MKYMTEYKKQTPRLLQQKNNAKIVSVTVHLEFVFLQYKCSKDYTEFVFYSQPHKFKKKRRKYKKGHFGCFHDLSKSIPITDLPKFIIIFQTKYNILFKIHLQCGISKTHQLTFNGIIPAVFGYQQPIKRPTVQRILLYENETVVKNRCDQ